MIFQMQTTLLPIGLCNIIDMKVRKFLWGDTNEKRRTDLINWDMVTKCKQQRGLGIRKMNNLNIVLMAKLGWKLLTKKEKLWARVITSKYMRGEPNILKFSKKYKAPLMHGEVLL